MPASTPKPIDRLEDLRFDDRNLNKGTERGAGMLERSLRDYGAGRSILADRDGVVLAGNKTLEQAAALGMEIQTVHSDGTKLVVVVRDDLTVGDKTARNLALADNRTSEASLSWDHEALAGMIAEGLVDADEFWFPEELAAVMAGDGPTHDDQPTPSELQTVTCPACGESFTP